MRELEEPKANRVAMKNKNGAKSKKKRQHLKVKKKLILGCIDNAVPSTINRRRNIKCIASNSSREPVADR